MATNTSEQKVTKYAIGPMESLPLCPRIDWKLLEIQLAERLISTTSKMFSKAVFALILTLFASIALSIDQKKWALINLERKCQSKPSSCDYNFFINEDEGKIFPCSFHIVSLLPDIVIASNLTFSGMKCSGTDKYDINADVSDQGRSLLLSVANPNEGVVAFFRYKDDEIKEGNNTKPQTSELFPLIPPEDEKKPLSKSRKGKGPATEDSLEYATKWRLFSPLRRIRDGIGKNVLDMAFMLVADDRGGMICNIHLVWPTGKNAQTQSFFNEKCTNNDWHVSWGYNEDQGSAVMTVIK
ncbi:unnamed protein product [Parascedosporium putredinis]|uniref:Uncharacterized protein n=1 Tax=Parascedosporium putredinis TaxID=1442378 RepID=A0A9P1MAL4_9PEZI|nr:unnamed protein product [Parascedosporium putredinis]CAI7992996.1 unnamed protein product [Parascedosporium putredinis]